jgi:hypothetical protein
MLRVESPKRLLAVLAVAIVALVLALVLSAPSTPAPTASAGRLAQEVVAATSAQPIAVVREQGGGTGSGVGLRLVDNSSGESAYEYAGQLLYLQDSSALYTRGRGCYFKTTLLRPPSPFLFAQDFLPPSGARPIYAKSGTGALTWSLPAPKGSKEVATHAVVGYDPKTHLMISASISSSRLLQKVEVSYPSVLSFPAAPTDICTTPASSAKAPTDGKATSPGKRG